MNLVKKGISFAVEKSPVKQFKILEKSPSGD
jgi:hypothetical protein